MGIISQIVRSILISKVMVRFVADLSLSVSISYSVFQNRHLIDLGRSLRSTQSTKKRSLALFNFPWPPSSLSPINNLLLGLHVRHLPSINSCSSSSFFIKTLEKTTRGSNQSKQKQWPLQLSSAPRSSTPRPRRSTPLLPPRPVTPLST